MQLYDANDEAVRNAIAFVKYCIRCEGYDPDTQCELADIYFAAIDALSEGIIQ